MRIGDFVDQALVASGGARPYGWSVDGLPDGLQHRTWGAVFGSVSQPLNDDRTVSLTVRDRRGSCSVRDVPVHLETLDVIVVNSGLVGEEGGRFRELEALGNAQYGLVPGGPLFVGYHTSPPRDKWLWHLHSQGYAISPALAANEFPAETVHVDGFLLQRHEVTNAEFAEFVRATGHVTAGWHHSDAKDAHPAVNVSFDDAIAYCKYKTEKAASAGLSLTYRLPNHWEWEKAAKGPAEGEPAANNGHARLYPWGDIWGQGMLHCGIGPRETTDVFAYQNSVSPFGVCDLAGNVSEWVDGGGINSGICFKHIRGASWRKTGQRYALTFYYGEELVEPQYFRDDVGFRCVVEVPRPTFPRQAFVPLGNDGFVDDQGELQFIGQYFMARFAVTNCEYAAFRPTHTFDPRFASHPVTNISYQDAQQFCQWKTQKEGRDFRLPTRTEWERAYRGHNGRVYPWGDQYSKYRCNSLESGWGRTVAVWDLWQGATPEGVYQLCGNTFEWMREGEALGGSWCSTCEVFGAAPYEAASADCDGREDIGFRYVTYQL